RRFQPTEAAAGACVGKAWGSAAATTGGPRWQSAYKPSGGIPFLPHTLTQVPEPAQTARTAARVDRRSLWRIGCTPRSGASRPTTRNERMRAPGADNTVPAGTLMQGKRGLIMGVANNRSIAWGIAKAVAAQGATLAFTYQGDAIKKRVEPLAAESGSKLVLPCDVTDQASVDAVFSELGRQWGKLDFLVHAIAFSDKDELDGRYVDTTETNFTQTMLISCYSLTALARRAEKLMLAGGS